MITKFNIFNEGLIQNEINMNLTFDEVMDLYKLDFVIKDYFIKNYPNEDKKIIGRYGHTMGKSSLDRLMKLAKKHKDIELITLINNHLSYINNFNKDPEAYRSAKKYNL